jgi:hypothetical protein
MTFENEALQAIVETLQGIQSELRTLNIEVSKLNRAQSETSVGAPGRTEFRPKRMGAGGRPSGPRFERSGPSREGRDARPFKSGPEGSRDARPFKGSSDKPFRGSSDKPFRKSR